MSSMLSICIPIYNFDCRPLVDDLLAQIKSQDEQVELIVIDDASEEHYQKLFKSIDKQVKFFQLEQNIGRSKIRNLLASYAKGTHLLFIDGDSSIIREDFLKVYLDHLKNDFCETVICGGSVYTEVEPEKKYRLRWKYSTAREQKSKETLRKHPCRSFTTNNFLIKKSTFDNIKFDDSLAGYGHEDTLFGFELMKTKCSIKHIDNAVLNGDLDTNTEYLEKTTESISNLLKIANKLDFQEEFVSLIPLLSVYFKIKLLGLEIFLKWWFKLNRKRLEKRFIDGKVNLILFDFYRLGALSILFRKLKLR